MTTEEFKSLKIMLASSNVADVNLAGPILKQKLFNGRKPDLTYTQFIRLIGTIIQNSSNEAYTDNWIKDLFNGTLIQN